ncbi:hypothetical protein [Candidatus Methylomirabilis sp.]|uniref:Bacteriophage N4 adsorption protein B n=1 Tax=Candidatus Methylomirabilis tolerans TaxID=3123416 RepID=A0AAJ1AHJ3_9BACT|nr:hypothetical protein [Candidatus Methylomirabilis sp.]
MSRRLGQILIDAKVMQPEQLAQTLTLQGPIPQPLGQLLVSQGLAMEEQIATFLECGKAQ